MAGGYRAGGGGGGGGMGGAAGGAGVENDNKGKDDKAQQQAFSDDTERMLKERKVKRLQLLAGIIPQADNQADNSFFILSPPSPKQPPFIELKAFHTRAGRLKRNYYPSLLSP